jgi:amino acid transporter
MNSFFAIVLASLNASVRVLYSMARGGVLPARLARVHPTRQVPVTAGYVTIGIALVLVLAGGAAWGPLNTWTFLSVLTAIALLLVYLAIHVSLPVYYRRNHPAEFSWLRHLVVPVIGGLVVLLPLYGTVWPIAPYPMNLVPWVFAAWVIAGLVYLRIAAKRHVDLAGAMQEAFSEG